MLAYYVATGFSYKKIINIKGNKLNDIASIDYNNIKKLNDSTFFLDKTKGDLYSYNHSSAQWESVANVGFHYDSVLSIQKVVEYVPKQN